MSNNSGTVERLGYAVLYIFRGRIWFEGKYDLPVRPLPRWLIALLVFANYFVFITVLAFASGLYGYALSISLGLVVIYGFSIFDLVVFRMKV